eukprot:s1199_g10.t1
MPFVEPLPNQYDVVPPASVLPGLSRVSEEETIKLCKVWDAQGLLRIFPQPLGPTGRWCYTKVFNNFKSAEVDRQIGDRRGQNYVEGRIDNGPSHGLPTAASLLSICPERFQQVLVGSIADRKDFYRQFWVTDERARTNAVFPPMTLGALQGTQAFDVFEKQFMCRGRRQGREEIGDQLHRPTPLLTATSEDAVIGAFGALFQGDHLGVEFATDARSRMLQSYGLLEESSRLQSSRPIVSDDCGSGLVIDDFFVVSKEQIDPKEDYSTAKSVLHFRRAKEAYKREGLQGSDDKDVVGKTQFTVWGGEVCSSEETVRRGAVTLAAPFEKWMALALMTANASSLPATSDALLSCLAGSWISLLLLRRPAMHFPRSAASELQQLACLAPVLCSNLAVPFAAEVFATDASMQKGGIVQSRIEVETAAVLWRTVVKPNGSFPVLSPSQTILAMYDPMFEENEFGLGTACDGFAEGAVEDEACCDGGGSEVHRPIGLFFEFIEVCGGAAVVTTELIGLQVFLWPSDRSYLLPRGFGQNSPKVQLGNHLAFAAMTLMFVAMRTEKCGLLEQPRRSKMRWLSEWQRLIELGAKETYTASCMFGSIHQKEFALLGANMHVELLKRPCSRDHQHVVIQGQYTKPSATYCPGMAYAFAVFFRGHIRAVQHAKGRLLLRVKGLEDLLSNDLCISLPWSAHSAWFWQAIPTSTC